MNSTELNTNYQVGTLQEKHKKSVIDLFVKIFCDNEPITKHLNIRYHEYEPFATEVVHKAIKDGLSKVVIDPQTGKIIACAMAEDLADPFIPHPAHYPRLYPIFALLDQLSRPFTSDKEFFSGKILHMFIALVDPAYQGKGLSTIVDMACIENAARKGFDFAYAEFTNPLSEKVIRQFQTLQLSSTVSYNDFMMENGERPFAGLTGAATAYIAAIRPGVNLNALPHCYKVLEKY